MLISWRRKLFRVLANKKMTDQAHPHARSVRRRAFFLAAATMFSLFLVMTSQSNLKYRTDLIWLDPTISSRAVRLMVVVSTAVNEENVRATVRQTWLSPSFLNVSKDELEVQYRFYIALPGGFSSLPTPIKNEIAIYKDIVVIDSVDDYYQNAFKTGYMLRWAAENSVGADFIIKTDGDSILHLKRLADRVLFKNIQQVRSHSKHLYFGHVLTYARIYRQHDNNLTDKTKTWVVSPDDVPFPHYFDYAQGGCVGMSFLLAKRVGELYNQTCSNTPGQGLEDATTGMLVEAVRREGWKIDVVDVSTLETRFGISERRIPYIHPWPAGLHKIEPVLMQLIFTHSFIRDERFIMCPDYSYPGVEQLPYKPGTLSLAPLPPFGTDVNNETLIEKDMSKWGPLCWNYGPGSPPSLGAQSLPKEHCCPSECYIKLDDGRTVNKWIHDTFE